MGDLVAGRYRLRALLGEGGMGSAWRADDERLGRQVAVKQLKLPPGLDGRARSQRVAWMEREARAAAMLRHRSIITVYDQFADEDGMPWIVMELIGGRSLEEQVKDEGRLSAQQTAQIGAQVADALAAAHAAGIVHRDLKPANVLLDGPRAVLTDFGIAALDGATTLTPTGALIGTPAYMAPEQLNGQHATPASDLWSLGATLYFAVEGRPAFTGPTIAALLLAVSGGEPRPMVHAGPLQPLLRTLMAKDPAQRPTADRAAVLLGHQIPPASHQAPDTDPTPRALPAAPPPATRPPRPLARRRLITKLGFIGLFGLVGLAPAGYIVIDEQSHWNPPPTPISYRLVGHTDWVNSVVFSPDGKTLATASGDKTVRLWDVATRKPIGQPLAGHTHSISSVAFSPDGKTLATGSWDDTVRLWDVATRKPIGRPLTRRTKDIESVVFSPDGKTLATASRDETVRLWDVATRKPIGQLLAGRTHWITSVAFSPDGKTLATASFDKTVRLWDVATRKTIGQPLVGRTHWISSVAFSPDGKTLATASGDRTVRLWDVATRKPIGQLLVGHTGSIHSVAFSPDGKTLATGSSDKTVRLWRL